MVATPRQAALHWVWFIGVAKASLLPMAYLVANAVEPFCGRFFG